MWTKFGQKFLRLPLGQLPVYPGIMIAPTQQKPHYDERGPVGLQTSHRWQQRQSLHHESCHRGLQTLKVMVEPPRQEDVIGARQKM